MTELRGEEFALDWQFGVGSLRCCCTAHRRAAFSFLFRLPRRVPFGNRRNAAPPQRNQNGLPRHPARLRRVPSPHRCSRGTARRASLRLLLRCAPFHSDSARPAEGASPCATFLLSVSDPHGLRACLGLAGASHPSPSGAKRHAFGSAASSADERLSAKRSGRGAGRGLGVREASSRTLPIKDTHTKMPILYAPMPSPTILEQPYFAAEQVA